MFCPKCGTKALDDAGFCQKCGAKLIVDTPAAQPAPDAPVNSTNQSGSTPKEAPTKKKSKKLPIIIGVAVLAVLAVIFIAVNWEGKTDYEATVRAHAPFANSQGLPYTYGEVFDKYIPDAKWEVRESDDMAHIDIIGNAKGTDAEMVITIKVSLDAKDPEVASITPESVSVSGNKSPTKDEAVGFLLAMFIAYDEGDKDLSNFSVRLNEIGAVMQGDISLTKTFTDADSGISFQYPSGWTILDSSSEFKVVEMLDSQNTADHVATLNVDLILDQDPYGVFTQNEATIRETVNENLTFMDFGDTLIGGIPAKALKYQMQQMNRDDIVVNFWYKIGENVYQVKCTYTSSDANKYEPLFEAIMDSYVITANNPDGEGIATKENDNDLTFRDISLTDWIGGPADIAYDVFGWPDYGTIIDESLYSGGEYFGYNVGFDSGISFVIDYQTDRIGWITGAAEAVEFNGVTLDMTRTKLIDLFGAPESEGAVSDELAGTEYYAMRYTIKGFPVEIALPDINSAATTVLISQNSY